jgi:hypothetical protein
MKNALDFFPRIIYLHPASLTRGRLLGAPTRWSDLSRPEPGKPGAGWCGARGRGSQPRTRDAPGSRPGPLRGSAFNGWTGTDEGRRKLPCSGGRRVLRPVAGSTAPGCKVAAAERREACGLRQARAALASAECRCASRRSAPSGFGPLREKMDARVKPGHDERNSHR